MDEQDEDFWITHIASTPEEDSDFTGLGCRGQSLAMLVAILIAIVVSLLFRF